MTYRPPHATILQLTESGGEFRVTVTFDARPTGRLSPGTLFREATPNGPQLELHRLVAVTGERLTFATLGSLPLGPRIGEVLAYQRWWDDDQFALVHSARSAWRPTVFQVRDADVVHPDGTRETRSGGWDHEHCRLCWAKIGLGPGQAPSAWFNGTDWMCEACYAKYLVPPFGRRFGDEV